MTPICRPYGDMVYTVKPKYRPYGYL